MTSLARKSNDKPQFDFADEAEQMSRTVIFIEEGRIVVKDQYRSEAVILKAGSFVY
jgi:hypothetical protein